MRHQGITAKDPINTFQIGSADTASGTMFLYGQRTGIRILLKRIHTDRSCVDPRSCSIHLFRHPFEEDIRQHRLATATTHHSEKR